MNKISVIGGAGRVGETVAVYLAQEELAEELVLIDVREGAPQGSALDISEARQYYGSDVMVTGSNNMAVIAGSKVVVITAGMPRKPGMSRSDVLEANVAILDNILEEVLIHAPDAILLVVSNPVDIMTWRAYTETGWPRSRIIGQAGVLDATRMAHFIAEETGFSVRDITTMVLGGHGDSMVPVSRFCTVNGIPVSHFIGAERMAEIEQRTRDGGAEVLGLRGNSSAYIAPAAATVTMLDSILHNRRRLLPCVAVLEGEYGQEEIAMGVPCVLGRDGIEKIVDLGLGKEEQAMFDASVEAVRKDVERLK